jgi:hypothetical protein
MIWFFVWASVVCLAAAIFVHLYTCRVAALKEPWIIE